MSGINAAKIFRETVLEIIKQAGVKTTSLKIGKVVKVDKQECDVQFDKLVITGVRLRSVINDSDNLVIAYPKVDSFVAVLDFTDDYRNMMVIEVSEVEKIEIVIEETKIIVDKEGVVINDGENDGMVKIKELTDKLNGLKDTVDALVNKFNTHNHPYTNVAAPATTSAILPVGAAQPPQPFNAKDYENDKIKH